MKGIERMMREKVSGDVARVSACEGIGRGVRDRRRRGLCARPENEGESKCQEGILSLAALQFKSKLAGVPAVLRGFYQPGVVPSEESYFLKAGSEVSFT